MKICWDNLETIYFSKNKNFIDIKTKKHIYVEKICPNCEEIFLGRKEKSICCCVECSIRFRFNKKLNFIKDDNGNIIKRRCFRCDEIKELSEFSITNSYCKKCNRVYKKKHKKQFASFDIYAHQIDFCEECKRASDNEELLEVRCTNCGGWFKPTNQQASSRSNALKYNVGELRFYCSEKCKHSCSIYNRRVFPKGFRDNSSREVQPELRQMCLERDNYTCIKCHSKENLICHHIEGILYNPLESADLDMVITVCEDCHENIHSQDGCKKNEMQCN